MRVRDGIICLLLIVLGGRSSRGAEIASNGSGGGPWSDPATWREKKIPTSGDDVVIQKNDVVTFDRNDDGKVTCQKLLIDPKGALLFKTRAGKIVCCVADEVESFGPIRLDGTRSADDYLELRLVGSTAAKRHVKLQKGSALLLYGRDKLPKDGRNVALTSPKVGDQKDDISGLVEAGAVSTIDVRRVLVHHVKLQATNIDNTGAKPNERLHITDNRFTGQGRLYFSGCDTPVISRNTFDAGKTQPGTESAVWVSASLPEIKDNSIRGPFYYGIVVYGGTDPVVTGNTVEKCVTGFHSYGAANSMIKNCAFRDCSSGFYIYAVSGVVENLTLEKNQTALQNLNSTVLLANVQVKDLLKGGQALISEGGSLTLLNCNILPKQIKIVPQAPPPGKPAPIPVTSFQYVVVGVKGAPEGARVELRTAKPALPADAADPNVRNSPAPLVKGLSPLPRSLMPLMVKAWTLDPKGQLVAAPEFNLKILGPSAKEGAQPPVLKTQLFRPPENGFRAMPNDSTPTLEVPLK